jgi:hypothetical protein
MAVPLRRGPCQPADSRRRSDVVGLGAVAPAAAWCGSRGPTSCAATSAGGSSAAGCGRSGAGTSAAAWRVGVMLWPSVSALGFCLVTALVIVLARRRTAQWERERNSAPALERSGVMRRRIGARRAARLRASEAVPPGPTSPHAAVKSARRRPRPSAVRPALAPVGRRLRAPRRDEPALRTRAAGEDDDAGRTGASGRSVVP